MPQLPLANAIRALSMDAVEKAQSGHCGLPLGFADVATLLGTVAASVLKGTVVDAAGGFGRVDPKDMAKVFGAH